ncbi:hypothetical protein [Paractinoplanes brasiliensis]|uniref:Uncharacterized protein n=1 Tax=Paractinoplanes brasiliensis TaxID=52695 RepID=A0A4R6JJU1_9ACTN|nr:hypothetical protein [Actinoplanes brasiliensis]TDO36470.1 hypothetical protein C8E87_0041 [Actinoplanes brasiliensis]GID32525.1 hypothetical protein Abr02nite_75080 [Actinoplanes brasiliensis]
MPGDPLTTAATVVAYQAVTLTELHGLLDQVEFDLEDVLARERHVSYCLDSVESEFDTVRAQLRALGITVPTPGPAAPAVFAPSSPRYAVPVVPVEGDFDRLVRLAEARLDLLGIDLTRDPLPQVVPHGQIANSLRLYAAEHGDVSWDETDWTVVLLAGTIATLLDIVLVRIPQDATFLGKKYTGSPLTKWLQDGDRAKKIHGHYLKRFEKLAKVPYDAPTTASTGGLVAGMRPATHRLQSLGHDPGVGFLAGIADLMRGTGTYIDKAGQLIQVQTGADPVGLITALITQVRHLLSDVYTPAGLQPPFFSLLQLGQINSPFALGPSGVKVPWTDVARHMYTNGYDLRHFFTMGITPGVVSATIRGYWLLKSYATGGTAEQRKLEHAKLTSMLLLGHAIATSGTLLKTGLVFGLNPAALNYNQILAMAPATIAWFKEAVARDHRINAALAREWEVLGQGLR